MRKGTFTTACLAGVLSMTAVDLAGQGRRTGAPGPQTGRATAAAAVTPAVADDPFSGPVVRNAPFSADATTTVTQVLSDGTRIEENTSAKFYRDGNGRLRREQTVLGLAALNPSGDPRTVITIDPDPDDPLAYTLDPETKTARQGPRSSNFSVALFAPSTNVSIGYVIRAGGSDPEVALRTLRVERMGSGRGIAGTATAIDGAVAQPPESLGTRQMEGVTVVGRRTKSVIPTGQIGNDRPIEITDERWESPDLKLLVRSHHHDPRTGDVEYRLTNIIRSEPPPDLFVVPPDYMVQGPATVITGAAATPGVPSREPGLRIGGARTGGAGQRSGTPAN